MTKCDRIKSCSPNLQKKKKRIVPAKKSAKICRKSRNNTNYVPKRKISVNNSRKGKSHTKRHCKKVISNTTEPSRKLSKRSKKIRKSERPKGRRKSERPKGRRKSERQKARKQSIKSEPIRRNSRPYKKSKKHVRKYNLNSLHNTKDRNNPDNLEVQLNELQKQDSYLNYKLQSINDKMPSTVFVEDKYIIPDTNKIISMQESDDSDYVSINLKQENGHYIDIDTRNIEIVDKVVDILEKPKLIEPQLSNTPVEITESKIQPIKSEMNSSQETNKSNPVTSNIPELQKSEILFKKIPEENTNSEKPNVESNSYLESLTRPQLIEKIQAYARSMKSGGIENCGDPDNPYFGLSWQALLAKQEELKEEVKAGRMSYDEFGDKALPIESLLNNNPGYLKYKEDEKINFFKEHDADIKKDYKILQGFISPAPISEADFTKALKKANPDTPPAQIKKLVRRIGTNKGFTWVRKSPEYIAKLAVPDVRLALAGTAKWSLGEMRAVYNALPEGGFKSDSTGEKAKYLAQFTANLEDKIKKYKKGEAEWDCGQNGLHNFMYYKNTKNTKTDGDLLNRPFTGGIIEEDVTGGETLEVLQKAEFTAGAKKARLAGKDRQRAGEKLKKNDKVNAKLKWEEAIGDFETSIGYLRKIIELIPANDNNYTARAQKEKEIASLEEEIANISKNIAKLEIDENSDITESISDVAAMPERNDLMQAIKKKSDNPKPSLGFLGQIQNKNQAPRRPKMDDNFMAGIKARSNTPDAAPLNLLTAIKKKENKGPQEEAEGLFGAEADDVAARFGS